MTLKHRIKKLEQEIGEAWRPGMDVREMTDSQLEAILRKDLGLLPGAEITMEMLQARVNEVKAKLLPEDVEMVRRYGQRKN